MILRIVIQGLPRLWLNYRLALAVKKVKPTKVDATVRDKLKSSNFIGNFDEAIQGKMEESEEGKGMAEMKSNNQERRIKTQKTKLSHGQQVKSPMLRTKPKVRDDLVVHQQNQKSVKEKSSTSLQKALSKLGKALDPINPKQIAKQGIETASQKQNKQIEQAIAEMKKLNLKDFSVLVHKLLVNSSGVINTNQKYIWKEIEEDFLIRFEPTTDPVKIRSYAKVVYSLAKSKVHRDNSSTLVSTAVSTNLQSLETKFALLLPSASHQSFSTIVTSLSRMGPLSQQFCYIAQRIYYEKQTQLNIRERVQLNYALTRNGRNVDTKLHTLMDSMNLKQILIMLRCYDNCGQLTKEILFEAERNIVLRKKEMNVIDIGDTCALYFRAACQGYRLSQELEVVLTDMYKLLRKNVNEVTLDKIWRDLPTVINQGYLQVQFMEQIIKTVRYLKKTNAFPQRIWRPMQLSFKNFTNLEIRTRLEQIQ